VGKRLAARGHAVLALRRRADLVPHPLRGLSVDLTRGRPDLPPLDLAHLVVALTARPRNEESYRATYVEGMARALDAVAATGQVPRRAVLVSSTGVFGDLDPAVLADESTPPRPADGPARMLLQAEQVFADRVPGGTVLRLSGLYGHGSTRLVDQVREGRVTDPNRWTNRIHRDDAAAAVVHLLTRDEPPEALYVGTDDEPALLGDVAAHMAAQLGAPTPPGTDAGLAHGKRFSNARLRASGWAPDFPTFREGYSGLSAEPSR
jgi:nucleoside-diphosphate-sugar epimerase